jgi:serine/threonine-protein kinase
MSDIAEQLNRALAGRYQVERELGRGGMATVYLAEDLKHRRKVAIKVLNPELTASLGGERFLREIETTANLRHPHILPLYDSGDAEGLLFYVMPLVEGESLRDRLTREKQLPVDEALAIARECADALSYAHARGIIHRDVKPENILLESGHAVIADFGIARAMRAAGASSLTGTGMAVGTPAYMSPEQASGDEDVDGRSDLYALACVLYEMLAGQPPFTGPTVESIVRQHMVVEAPPVTNLRPVVPPLVASALQRALAKNPTDRFNPVAQFAEAIGPHSGQTTSHVAPSAPSAVPLYRPTTWRRLLVVGVTLLVALAIPVLVVEMRDRASSAPAQANAASIAVLPFADLSPDRTNTYLGDGIAETLINALANVSGLQVTARTSAFSFRDKATDIKAIGRQLGVATVLEGSVQRAGDRLRVTAQLIKTSDGLHLWSQNFDRPASDIFAVQDEVSRAVVSALKLSLATTADSSGPVGGTRNAQAYEAYLLGRFHWNLRTVEGMVHATEAFKRAVALDSLYALAWTGLADTYALSIPSEYGQPGVNRDSILTLGEIAARRAIALAPRLGEAQASLGELLEHRKRWDESVAAFEQSVRLSPAYATGHQWYGYALQGQGRWDEALKEMEVAHRLEPLSHVITLSVAILHSGADRFADASPLFAQGLAQAPEAWYAWGALIGQHLALGHVDSAAAALRRYHAGITGDTAGAVRRERMLRDPASRAALIEELMTTKDYWIAIGIARWLRDDDAVVALLKRMHEVGRGPTPWIGVLTMLGPKMRADARVRAALPQLGAQPLAPVAAGR